MGSSATVVCKVKRPRLALIKELDVIKVVGQRMAKHMIRSRNGQPSVETSRREHHMHAATAPYIRKIFAGPSANGKTEMAI